MIMRQLFAIALLSAALSMPVAAQPRSFTDNASSLHAQKHNGKHKAKKHNKHHGCDDDDCCSRPSFGTSIRKLGYGYTADVNIVYYNGCRISHCHPRYFKVLKYGYAVDSHNVYYKGYKVRHADARTFRTLKGGYARDRYHKYYKGRRVR